MGESVNHDQLECIYSSILSIEEVNAHTCGRSVFIYAAVLQPTTFDKLHRAPQSVSGCHCVMFRGL
jgi:hypothetical protein